MCGIVGYVGFRNGFDECLHGLHRLEYRGYDSSGVAALDHAGDLIVERSVGRVQNLADRIASRGSLGRTAIGHTRWATHGKAEECNAHPHVDCTGKFAVVHNGIIENYLPLRRKLEDSGHAFASCTDSEVIAHLVEEAYQGDFLAAVRGAVAQLHGSFALAIIHSEPRGERIIAARCGSPMVIGMGDGEAFLASDVAAVLHRTRQIVFLEEGDFAELSVDGARFYGSDGQEVARPTVEVSWSADAAEKGGYDHYMRKEIAEQPTTITETLRGRIRPGAEEPVDVPELDRLFAAAPLPRRVAIAACGTSFHASMVGKVLIERWARIPTDVFIASEFRYEQPLLDVDTMFCAVSQSGETADTLASVALAKESELPSLAICNVVGSTLVRDADETVFTRAGPEIGVASTKAFTGQVVALMLFALGLAQRQGLAGQGELAALPHRLVDLPNAISAVIAREPEIEAIAARHAKSRQFLFLGRGLQHPVALEGALKLKEISYTPAEGGPAGEIKHGPIALVDEQLCAVFLATPSATHDKLLANMSAVAARSGRIVAVAVAGDERVMEVCDDVIEVPHVAPELQVLVNTVALQLFSYHVAACLGRDIDKPRNLAKSVTVE